MNTQRSMTRPVAGLGLSLVCALAPGMVHAQQVQIDWGSAAIYQKMITSDGAVVSASEFSVELGGFSGGFVPTASNFDEWIEHWMVFDAITDPDPDTNGPGGTTADGFLSGSGTDARFVGTGHLLSDQTSASEDGNGTDTFASGLQAYVFIRNSDTPDEDAEWLLYTSTTGNDWEFPTATGGQTTFPETWFVSEADTAVWGGVHGTINGGGEHTDMSTDFILRTHSFAVVPEPGLMALVVCGALTFLRRRRRS